MAQTVLIWQFLLFLPALLHHIFTKANDVGQCDSSELKSWLVVRSVQQCRTASISCFLLVGDFLDRRQNGMDFVEQGCSFSYRPHLRLYGADIPLFLSCGWTFSWRICVKSPKSSGNIYKEACRFTWRYLV